MVASSFEICNTQAASRKGIDMRDRCTWACTLYGDRVILGGD